MNKCQRPDSDVPLHIIVHVMLYPQGIYGCAKPRQLQGLMGPSGAGKSTLMDLLAMRTDHDGAAAVAPGRGDDDAAAAVPGTPSKLLVNGVEVKRQDFMAISAYVPQVML